MMFTCIPCVILALWLELKYNAPIWVHLVTTLPFLLATCILPLRPLKGWLVSSQFFYKAEEGRIVKTSKPDSAGTRNGAPAQPPSAD